MCSWPSAAAQIQKIKISVNLTEYLRGAKYPIVFGSQKLHT